MFIKDYLIIGLLICCFVEFICFAVVMYRYMYVRLLLEMVVREWRSSLDSIVDLEKQVSQFEKISENDLTFPKKLLE